MSQPHFSTSPYVISDSIGFLGMARDWMGPRIYVDKQRVIYEPFLASNF